MSADRDLVLRIQENDTHAFDTIYWKYHKGLYKNALKLTKDEQAASDILQEVFTILWEKRHSIKQEQSLSGWLFVISFNQSVNFQRQKLRALTLCNTTESVNNSEEEEDSELFECKYLLMQKAVETLSPQKQKVFTLCKIQGKSYEETADILNISKHTVKEYLSYSMISIKEFVKKHSGEWRTTSLIVLFSFLEVGAGVSIDDSTIFFLALF
ncbi:sigma-70 family RNA polymerase sigma factor [Pedobacter sp. P351]|uniref:RNA polymerase sigma factor n=1 Tax=Pedobacter superstes TaxID=3133441 RepID=UPI003096AE5A